MPRRVRRWGDLRSENKRIVFEGADMTENTVGIEDIKQILGIENLTDRELACIEVWNKEMKADWPLIEYAVTASVEINRDKPKMLILKYADALIKDLKSRGLETPEDAEAYRQKCFEENKRRKELSDKARHVEVPHPVRPDPQYSKSGLVELKPCPFCGSKDIVIKNQYSSKRDAYYTLAQCVLCGANTRTSTNFTNYDPSSEEFWKSDSVQEVATLWNTRV